MTPAMALFTGISVALLLMALWLLAKPLPAELSLHPSQKPRIDSLLPHHGRHFPQMRGLLNTADGEFLAAQISQARFKSWRAERRRVLRDFLTGLEADYASLDYLARTVAALSPHVHRKSELERVWLGLRFRALYRMVSIRLATHGPAPVGQLERLTQLLATLASRLEAGTAGLELASAPPTAGRSLKS